MVKFTTVAFGQKRTVGSPGECALFTPSKKKESGTLSCSLVFHPPLGDEEFRVLEPGLGGGQVALEPTVEVLQ
jgi:hypothetical protein